MDDSDFFRRRFDLGFPRPMELTWGASATSNNNNKIQIASVDVKGYKPDELSVKFENEKFVVRGDHHKEGDEGFESYKFEKSFAVPQGVDPKTVSSRVTAEGRMYLEAPRPRPPEQQLVSSRPAALARCVSDGELTEDESKYTISLSVPDFQPEEISCKVDGQELTISAEQESESEGHFSKRSISRHFTLPENASMDTLRSFINDKGMLVVEADKVPASGAAKVRMIPVIRNSK